MSSIDNTMKSRNHWAAEEGHIFALADKHGLEPGSFYHAGPSMFLATSDEDLQRYGHFISADPLPLASEETYDHRVYFNRNKRIAVTVRDGAPGAYTYEWVDLNNAFISAEEEAGGVRLTKMDGSTFLIPTVDFEAILGDGVDGAFVIADEDGNISRSTATVTSVLSAVDTKIETALEPIETALEGKASIVEDAVEDNLVVFTDEGDIKDSGVKVTDTIAGTLGGTSDDKVATEKAVFTHVDTQIKAALEGNRWRGEFAIDGGDEQITDTLATEKIGVGDNWTVKGVSGATGTFATVPIRPGDTIRFVNEVPMSGTIQATDFVVVEFIGTELLDSLTGDGNTIKGLTANMGYVLDQEKLDKIPAADANQIVFTAGTTNGKTNVKTSGKTIVDTIGLVGGSIVFEGVASDAENIVINSEALGDADALPATAVIDAVTYNVDYNSSTLVLTLTPATGAVTGGYMELEYDGLGEAIEGTINIGTTSADQVPTNVGVVNYVETRLGGTSSEIDGKLDGKMDKTDTGGTDELLLADGAGGAKRAGVTIVQSIPETEVTPGDWEKQVVSMAALAEFMETGGLNWQIVPAP